MLLNFSTIHSSYSRPRLLLSDSVAIDGEPSDVVAAAAAAAAAEVDGFSTQHGFSTQPSAAVETR